MTDNQPTRRFVLIASVAVLIFVVFYAIPWLTEGPSEPLYSIRNMDEYPHDVTIKITKPGSGLYVNESITIEAGEYISAERPIFLKWKNPLRSDRWNFCIESENVMGAHNMIPHRVNTMAFILHNESGELKIDVSEIMV